MPASREYALTLARGLAVLECFSPARPSLTGSEAAEAVGISRAAARRLLLTLADLEYVEQDGSRFTLTDKIASVGDGLIQRGRPWDLIAPDVIGLAQTLNEPCSVSVLDGLHIRFVIRDQTRRIFSSPLGVGDHLPANCSAAGKVLLAALDADELDRRLTESGPLAAPTSSSIGDPELLRRELQQVRIDGWASAEGEMEAGTIAVAVPLFGADHEVLAALALSSHTMRRSMDDLVAEFLPTVRHVATRISDQLAAGGDDREG